MGELELDPRYDWYEVPDFGRAEPGWIRGRCRHIDVVPVTSCVTGEHLARLCLTCDAQLPPARPARLAGDAIELHQAIAEHGCLVWW
jgi:hypothetical protein